MCLCPLVPKSPEKELYAPSFHSCCIPQRKGDAKRIMILAPTRVYNHLI